MVASAVFPELAGLTWNTTKRPRWSTKVAPHESGKEFRTALWQYPRWDFVLSYDYLYNDPANALTSLTDLMGFFMLRKGSSESFLFKDATDYRSQGGVIATGDGATTSFTMIRSIGSYSEPVGLMDLRLVGTFTSAEVSTSADTVTIIGHGLDTGDGPMRVTSTAPGGLSITTGYWMIVVDANTLKFATSYANAIAGTAINITGMGSGAMSLTRTVVVYVNGVAILQTLTTKTAPRTVAVSSAPALGAAVTADFDYFYICRFGDDMLDFNNFMDKLWELKKCEFSSVLE